jgi:hypothetical protein
MGSAYYSMLAEFPKKITAKQKKAITEFFVQGSQAYDYWQEHHDQKTKEFWQGFRAKYPVLTEYLASAGMDEKDTNDLAGSLSFGTGDDIQCSLAFTDVKDKTELTYQAEVWHFANWEPLTDFLRVKFGASSVEYMSDEAAPGGVDLIRLQRSARQSEIVDALLKQNKKFLPTLIGIHPDLDALIEPLLRK